MFKALNFDIIFVIVLLGFIACAFFSKSRKVQLNFFLFLFSFITVGLLAYFDIDKIIFESNGKALFDLFNNFSSSVLTPTNYPIIYFIMLMLVVLVLFGLLKLVALLVGTERRRLKSDITYTTPHRGVSAVFVSIFKFALLAYLAIVLLIIVNPIIGFDLSNSIVITTFQKFDPIVKYVTDKALLLFGIIGL